MEFSLLQPAEFLGVLFSCIRNIRLVHQCQTSQDSLAPVEALIKPTQPSCSCPDAAESFDTCPVVSVRNESSSVSHTDSLYAQWNTKGLQWQMLAVCRYRNTVWHHQPSGGKEAHWLILTGCDIWNFCFKKCRKGSPKCWTVSCFQCPVIGLQCEPPVVIMSHYWSWIGSIFSSTLEGGGVSWGEQLFPEVCQIPLEKDFSAGGRGVTDPPVCPPLISHTPSISRKSACAALQTSSGPSCWEQTWSDLPDQTDHQNILKWNLGNLWKMCGCTFQITEKSRICV